MRGSETRIEHDGLTVRLKDERDEATKLAMALDRDAAAHEIDAAIAWLKDERGSRAWAA